jgi:hypothetical protein
LTCLILLSPYYYSCLLILCVLVSLSCRCMLCLKHDDPLGHTSWSS